MNGNLRTQVILILGGCVVILAFIIGYA